ncbi:MAG: heme biosynthesis protein HemY [Burkholderiales bacterium PBB3]|nr:MAG: heme biosynthesis protein HemY [Burkholderiales bacterium PBB3]
MRAALWLMALFAVAAVSALFAGNNHGTVTVYWPPHRVDVSLNLALLTLAIGFLLLHLALRALSALLRIPQRARDWRLSQRERAIYASLLDAWFHLVSGRFVRARKAGELMASLEESVQRSGEQLPQAGRLRAIAHLLAAEGAHAVQDKTRRDFHFQEALKQTSKRDAQDAREGMQMRAARWAFDDRDAGSAMQWLDQLPHGAARRTLALRLRFKAARHAGKAQLALETARQLTKHRSFSEAAGRSIARGLAIEMLRSAHDQVQVQAAWNALSKEEQALTDVALEATERLIEVGGDTALAHQWVLPVWSRMVQSGDALTMVQKVKLVRILEAGFSAANAVPDAAWLARIESAQMGKPSDAVLQYLAGCICMRLSLWGKAQQLIKQSLPRLQDRELQRDAWLAMAQLAEQRNDIQGATEAYREAAKR